MIPAEAAPPPSPGVPEPVPISASSSVVRAKMRSRAALYRAERSAKVPADAADEPVLLSLVLAPFWVERLRMRMGDWKAEAGGTTLEMAPVRGDVATSWGIGASLFLHTHAGSANFSVPEGKKKTMAHARVVPYSLAVFLARGRCVVPVVGDGV